MNKDAAILLFPSINTWFLTIRYRKLAAFSSIVGYRSSLLND